MHNMADVRWPSHSTGKIKNYPRLFHFESLGTLECIGHNNHLCGNDQDEPDNHNILVYHTETAIRPGVAS